MPTEKIECPKCNWRPDEHAIWHCACGHEWNTFHTGGKCPRCKRQWEHTQCLNCWKWSPHIDWYKNLDAELLSVLKSIESPVEAE